MQFDDAKVDVLAALVYWAVFVCGFLFIAGVVASLSSLFTAGVRAPAVFFGGVADGLVELFSLSPRRLGALTMLTFKEAIRRKALLVFVVFAVLFMFGGWFLTGSETQKDFQTKVYVSFALWVIMFLLLPMALLLSCWGIPEDIRIRSMHTVVTKPARRMEVVLGRMLGYGLIGTLILSVMGLAGYIWIVRQVPAKFQHQLICRQPHDGSLQFLDRQGQPGMGINVGDISMFRSYIEGATKARAIWTFDNVDTSLVHGNQLLRLESRFQAFRSHKGNMDRSLYFQYTLTNPDDPSIRVPLALIPVSENRANDNFLSLDPIRLVDASGKPLSSAELSEANRKNFFKDLVSKDRKVNVEVACIEPGMYIGAARIDLFFRKPDRPFWVGYLKSLLEIEAMLLLVVILGVTASTFVKGPVATFFTFAILMVGMFAQEFMDSLIAPPDQGGFQGGGVFESIYRIVMHMNPTTELPENPAFFLMQWVDWLLKLLVWSVRYYIPNCRYVTRMPEYLANGFDVDWMRSLLPCLLVTAGFFLPCLFVGYYSLKLRELEAK